MMREKTCCFTGHRKLEGADLELIVEKLKEEISKLIEKGFNRFVTGGALGFDTFAALIVIKLKEKYPKIKLSLVLPCRSQTRRWSPEDKEIYDFIKYNADDITYAQEEYSAGCMFKRNRMLVDLSSVCICYLISDEGGTAYTVGYAKKQNLEIINLADKNSF